jgi:serine/threonine-protein kinase
MTPCPPDDELRQLLAGDLPAAAAEALTRHTDGCADCQSRLGQLGEDPTLGRWRELLRPDGGGEDNLPPTKIAAPSAVAPSPALLRRLGGKTRLTQLPPAPPGYEILSELGRGGMGVVYQARQTALKRPVALKVIASGPWAGPDELARFRAEAEAAARLQHPNIVQVYEVGEYEGRPFFSLEYVAGGTLAAHLAGKPLPARAAAELLRTLALAMHAAHERGIVHRDLKPANVLLASPGRESGESPIPKVADFGLAKRLGDSSMTQSGMVVGTPSYMAPEQARGQVRDLGPSADVYALGAILFECLTGRPPFNGATPEETLRQVREQPPVAPRRLNAAVPRDLETVCLKCLEKEPPRRYASAQALADDLGRFLGGRPIEARPAGLAERLFKWAKRRPAVAALVAVAAGALVVIAALGLWSYLRISHEAELASKREAYARRALDDWYTNVAEEWLADEPQGDPLQQMFLTKARDQYEELARLGGDDPDGRRETARAWFHAGQLERTLSRRVEAADDYGQAIALQQQLRDRFPAKPTYRQDQANSYNWLGELHREAGAPREAEDNFRKALELQEGLRREAPDDPDYRRELARSHSNLGLVEMDDPDRAAAARDDFDRAVTLLSPLADEPGAKAEYRFELARTLTNRGVLHHENDRPREAEADYRRAAELLRNLLETSRPRVIYRYNLGIARQNLGNLLLERRDYPGALEELRAAEALFTRLTEDFPTRPRYAKKQARTWNSLGSVLAKTGKPGPARELWEKAREHLDKLVRDDPESPEYQADLGIALGNLGWLKAKGGDREGAAPLLADAVGHLETAVRSGPKRLDYRRALSDRYQTQAEVMVLSGDRAGAVKAATALAEVFPERAKGYYYAACFVARCIPLAEKEGAAAEETARAAGLLGKALQKGLTGGERLPDDERIFQPLAAHPEFRGLLAELEAKRR